MKKVSKKELKRVISEIIQIIIENEEEDIGKKLKDVIPSEDEEIINDDIEEDTDDISFDELESFLENEIEKKYNGGSFTDHFVNSYSRHFSSNIDELPVSMSDKIKDLREEAWSYESPWIDIVSDIVKNVYKGILQSMAGKTISLSDFGSVMSETSKEIYVKSMKLSIAESISDETVKAYVFSKLAKSLNKEYPDLMAGALADWIFSIALYESDEEELHSLLSGKETIVTNHYYVSQMEGWRSRKLRLPFVFEKIGPAIMNKEDIEDGIYRWRENVYFRESPDSKDTILRFLDSPDEVSIDLIANSLAWSLSSHFAYVVLSE